MAGMKLVPMVNTFVDAVDGGDVSHAIYKTAAIYHIAPHTVVESVYPYVSDKIRDRLFSMKTLMMGAQYIYHLRRKRGRPASRMSRYYRQVA